MICGHLKKRGCKILHFDTFTHDENIKIRNPMYTAYGALLC